MRIYNSNKYLAAAGFSGFIYFGIGHFVQLPAVIEGFSMGICITIYLISLYSLNNDISKIQNFKKKLTNRLTK